MIKIATIEDEENIRQEIVRYIKKGIGSIEGVEVDVYESAERYLLVGGRYDLVISDIELPGISGLELGKRIKENNPDVYLVFLTSHSEFASESYIIERLAFLYHSYLHHLKFPKLNPSLDFFDFLFHATMRKTYLKNM